MYNDNISNYGIDTVTTYEMVLLNTISGHVNSTFQLLGLPKHFSNEQYWFDIRIFLLRTNSNKTNKWAYDVTTVL